MAKINGTVFHITNLTGFFTSYVLNPTNPTASTFAAASNCRVSLKHNLGDNTWGGLLPDAQTTPVKVSATGGFSINVGTLNTIPGLDGQIIVEELLQTVTVPVVGRVEVWGVVYRSAPFTMSTITEATRKIWYQRVDVPSSAYVTQTTVSDAVKAAKSSLPAGVDSISARIASSGLAVSGAGRGAKITFSVKLKGSKSHDLDAMLTHAIEDFDIDLPGPDFITTLCVNEDEIESQVRTAIAKLVKTEVSPLIKDAIVSAASTASGLPAATVRTLLDSQATLSVPRVTYPQTGTFTVPGLNIPVPQYSIKIEPSAGVPRSLFG